MKRITGIIVTAIAIIGCSYVGTTNAATNEGKPVKKTILAVCIASTSLLAGCAPLAPTHDYRIDASYNDYQAWKGHGPLQHNERCKGLTAQGKCDAGQWPVTGAK